MNKKRISNFPVVFHGSERHAMPPECDGSVVTLNAMGYMVAQPDQYIQDFISYASLYTEKHKFLDIGAAYGVATLPVLAHSPVQIVANDLDPRHLEILYSKVPDNHRQRLQIISGAFPHDLSFPPETFQGILASRVLHFLKGNDILKALKDLYTWLKPGGCLFLIVMTPYMANLKNFIPHFERSKASGVPWPGYIEDTSLYYSTERQCEVPPFLTVFDQDLICDLVQKTGFVVEKSHYTPTAMIASDMRLEGRENISVLCHKI